MSDSLQPRLSTGQAAKVLGVHASTVKRWFEEGFGDAPAPGSHRRIALDAVLAEGRARGYSTYLDVYGRDAALAWAAMESVEAGDYGPLAHLIYRWVKSGRGDWIGSLLLHCGEEGELSPEVLDGAFGGTLAMVGNAWEEGRLRVGEERAVSWQVAETLLELIRRAEEGAAPDAGKGAVVGSMEGDHHFLGPLLVRALLTRKRWSVEFLGPDVPIEEFVASREASGAQLVCVSFTPPMGPPDVRRCVDLLAGLSDPGEPFALAVGGSGTRGVELPARAHPFRGLFQADSLVALSGWLDAQDLSASETHDV